MELVEEFKKAEIVIGVLTGNGPTEHKVLKGIAKKYDGGKKILYFPRRPGYQHGSGLSVLKVTKIYVSKYNIKDFLCLIDREYIKTSITEREIENKLKEFGVEVGSIQKFLAEGEEALRVEGTVGIHKFILWTAIIGREKCIEENIAKILEAKFREIVEPTKDGVKSILKKHHVNIERLMASASISKIKASFPALDTILSSLESNEG
ncbi:MAG: hypothetical protein ACPL1Z_03545 [Candidatus Bathyarchaeales archaeon]